MAVYANAPTFGYPPPAHTLTESAEAARRSVRALRVERVVDKIVVKRDAVVPDEGWPVPAAASRLAKLAAELGFEVRVAHGWRTLNAGRSNEGKSPAVQVAGLDSQRGFRATWANGKAIGALWYEPGVAPQSLSVTQLNQRIGR